jgi:hypothetical protein
MSIFRKQQERKRRRERKKKKKKKKKTRGTPSCQKSSYSDVVPADSSLLDMA